MSKITNQNLAFCGLYCPHCYQVKVSNAAKVLKREMDAATNKGAKYLNEVSKSFSGDIDVLISKECNLYCRVGGGSKCKIKLCCLDKKLNGCWECKSFETCDKISKQFKKHCKDINNKGIDTYIENYF